MYRHIPVQATTSQRRQPTSRINARRVLFVAILFAATVFGGFGGFAIAFLALGLYGYYTQGRRTRQDIAERNAVASDPRHPYDNV